MDESTTLLAELEDFNDDPLTDEDRAEMKFYQEQAAKEKAEEQAVIAQVLREAGVDVYANEDNEDYC